MSYSQKVYTISLSILLAAAIFLFIADEPGGNHGGMGYGLGMMVFTAAEVILLLIAALVLRFRDNDRERHIIPNDNQDILDAPGRRKRLPPGQKRLTFVIAAGLVALVGFSVCMGGMTLF